MFAHSSRLSRESSQYTISANDSLLTLTGVLWEKSRLSKTKSFPRLLKVSGFLEMTPFSFWGKSRRFAITPSSSVKSPSFYNNLLPHLPRVRILTPRSFPARQKPQLLQRILYRPWKSQLSRQFMIHLSKTQAFTTTPSSSVESPSFCISAFLSIDSPHFWKRQIVPCLSKVAATVVLMEVPNK